jgi:DNA-binding transcriptional LysR family regulator
VLWPVLEAYCRRYPLVEPDVQLDDRIGNWVEDRVDVGFRAGTPPDGGVIARRLLPLQLVVCAAPAYIAKHGAPASIDELVNHHCSGFRHPSTGKVMPWDFQMGEEIVSRAIPAHLCTNDVELESRAVLAGDVIGQLVGVTAVPLVRSGQLVPLLTEHVTEHLTLYLYYGNRAAQPARVRAFIDLAVEMVADNTRYFFEPGELARAAGKRRRTR